MQKLIIDGYNVIYTDERLRRVACKDLERARNGLIEMLEAYVRRRHIRATVVFDGRGGIAETAVALAGKLQIVFSASGQTADQVIVSTLSRAANAREFIVVTSDMADIGRNARSLGCDVIGSKRFLARLSSVKSDSKATDQPGVVPEVGDTEYWLNRFEEDDADKSADE